jgi:hypothetical protein
MTHPKLQHIHTEEGMDELTLADEHRPFPTSGFVPSGFACIAS